MNYPASAKSNPTQPYQKQPNQKQTNKPNRTQNRTKVKPNQTQSNPIQAPKPKKKHQNQEKRFSRYASNA